MNDQKASLAQALMCTMQHGVSIAWWIILVAAVLSGAVSGCANKKQHKKADGYYQEGLANLPVDRQGAFVSFQKAVREDPNHRDAHYYIGHIYTLQQRYAEAEDEFRIVISIDPDYPDAYNYLGQVVEAQGRTHEAIRLYRRALSYPLYQTPDIAWFNLGKALANQGDMEGATEAFQNALNVQPPNVPPGVLNLHMGRAYYRLGDDQKAREALTRSASLDRGGEAGSEAEKLLERLRP